MGVSPAYPASPSLRPTASHQITAENASGLSPQDWQADTTLSISSGVLQPCSMATGPDELPRRTARPTMLASASR